LPSDKTTLHEQLEVKNNEMMGIMSKIPSDKILKDALDAAKKQLSHNISNLKDSKQEYKKLSKQDLEKEHLHLKACQRIFSKTPEVFKKEIGDMVEFDKNRKLSQQSNATTIQKQEQIINKNVNSNPSNDITQDVKANYKNLEMKFIKIMNKRCNRSHNCKYKKAKRDKNMF